jgi:hypothetical protein
VLALASADRSQAFRAPQGVAVRSRGTELFEIVKRVRR